MTQPWQGRIDALGLGFAVFSAVGWATYILLTQRVGDRFEGLGGLTLTIPVAAVTAAIPGIPQAARHLTGGVLLASLGLAILLPVLPYAFELLALRHLTQTAFGTLMALEPAMGLLLGMFVLHQRPGGGQVVGILLVVFAGAAAQRGGRRVRAGEVAAGQLDGAAVEPAVGTAAGPPAGQANSSSADS
jgi:inner membrane transporter RhtA